MRASRLFVWAILKALKAAIAATTPGDRSYLASELMQDRFDRKTRALGDFFNKSTMAWKNKKYDVEVNGEAALLRRLQPFNPVVLFDAGANIGDWSLAALHGLPDARVHAFEIAPVTAKELARNLTPYSARVIVNAFGLGRQEGEIKLYFSPESSTAASMVPGVVEFSARDHEIHRIEQVTARITTGDQYLSEHRIDRVDFLKIDVEGAEWDVLEGFANSFMAKKIQMVQFEYGPLNLQTRKLLIDYWKFFTDNDFLVGKLYPEGVAFKTFDMSDEDFIGPNFIACLNSRNDLIEGLRCDAL
jgi:FkbM family methyltransferase